jgi:hypothetical protein
VAKLAALLQKFPLKRFGQPEDIVDGGRTYE